MKKEILLTEKLIIKEIILSNLALAVFMTISLNALRSIMVISEIIMLVDFNELVFSFKNGYYTINDREIGIPVFMNIVLTLLVWRIMVWHSLKIFYENVTVVNIKSKTNFLKKFVHFFFYINFAPNQFLFKFQPRTL